MNYKLKPQIWTFLYSLLIFICTLTLLDFKDNTIPMAIIYVCFLTSIGFMLSAGSNIIKMIKHN